MKILFATFLFWIVVSAKKKTIVPIPIKPKNYNETTEYLNNKHKINSWL